MSRRLAVAPVYANLPGAPLAPADPVVQRMEGMMTVVRNPDHVTVAVADGAAAIPFFELLGFTQQHVATIDGGPPARYMGMPDMEARHITLVLEGAEPRFEIQL